MEREGWEAGIGTDVEAPVGGMYEGCSECRPLWPIYVGKKKKNVQWQLMQKFLI